MEELKGLALNEEFIGLYDVEERNEKMNASREKAGRNAEAREIAISMISKSYKIEEISEITKLPIEEIESLKEEINS